MEPKNGVHMDEPEFFRVFMKKESVRQNQPDELLSVGRNPQTSVLVPAHRAIQLHNLQNVAMESGDGATPGTHVSADLNPHPSLWESSLVRATLTYRQRSSSDTLRLLNHVCGTEIHWLR